MRDAIEDRAKQSNRAGCQEASKMRESLNFEKFKNTLCSFKIVFYHLLTLQMAILVLLLFSLVAIEPEGTSYFLLQVDLFVLVVSLVMTVLLIRYCRDY